MSSNEIYLNFGKAKNKFDGFHDHLKQVPSLVEYTSELTGLFDEVILAMADHPNVKYTLQRVQYQYNLQRICEINESLILGLKHNNYSTVEALSRVSLESSVNLLYLLGEETNERANGLIQGYLKKNIYKAKKWLEFSTKTKDESGINSALKLREAMEVGQRIFRFKNEAKPKRWPDSIKAKFEAVGMEESYVTLFSSSSDSVHTGAEDIYNRTFVEFLDKDVKHDMAKGIIAEKASFAVYLTICSLIHSIKALSELCEKINEDDWKISANDIHKKIFSLKKEHEIHHQS